MIEKGFINIAIFTTAVGIRQGPRQQAINQSNYTISQITPTTKKKRPMAAFYKGVNVGFNPIELKPT